MNEFIKQIEAYNIFNYLVPGVVGTTAILWCLDIDAGDANLFVAFFLFYFSGLVISRMGSLILEPMMKSLKIVKYAPYHNFLQAAKKDEKLELMSQENNMYRTYIAMLLLIGLTIIYSIIRNKNQLINDNPLAFLLGISALTILLTLSYRKQTQYVTKRIEAAL